MKGGRVDRFCSVRKIQGLEGHTNIFTVSKQNATPSLTEWGVLWQNSPCTALYRFEMHSSFIVVCVRFTCLHQWCRTHAKHVWDIRQRMVPSVTPRNQDFLDLLPLRLLDYVCPMATFWLLFIVNVMIFVNRMDHSM